MLLVIVQTAVLLLVPGYLVYRVHRLKRELGVLRTGQAAAAKKTDRLVGLLNRIDKKWEKSLQKTFSETIWPQIESLEAIGRILDGKQYLPPTRRAAASPDLLMHVLRIIRAESPLNIVECGSGTSTIVFAMALKAFNQSGHIFSIENDEAYAEQVRDQLRERGLDASVTLVVAPLVEKKYPGCETPIQWYDIDKSRLPASIDLLFVDGPEGTFQGFSRYPAGPELIPLMSPTGKIILDDAARHDEAAMPGMWTTLFPSLAAQPLRAEKGATQLSLRIDTAA
ncbi:MAG: class I SAM-dependent methyltransferase [Hyphomicrobiales bacterium]|nr:class I SAM-dependent methyltransferase [Hyphomicrobiales bacterium]